MRTILLYIKKFLFRDIWSEEIKNKNFLIKILIYILRIIIITVNNFIEDKCILRASALVYTTLLAIVPILALSFSILKGFKVHFKLQTILNNFLAPLGDKAYEISQNIVIYVNKTNFASLGFIGLLFLIVTVISVMSTIEKSFNEIWNVKKSRYLSRKFSDYISIIVIGPTLIILSMGIIATLQAKWFTSQFFLKSVFGVFILFLIKLLPFILLTLTFTFIFVFIPNTKVKFYSGFFAAIITALIFIKIELYYNYFSVISVKYNAIYGMMALIPLFLIWIYICWLIVLFGAEISYAIQNCKTYTGKFGTINLSHREIEFIAFIIYYFFSKNFQNNKSFSLTDVIDKLKLPERIIKQTIFILAKSGFLTVQEENGNYILPLQNPDSVHIKEFIERLKYYKEEREFIISKKILNEFDILLSSENINKKVLEIDENLIKNFLIHKN